MCCLMQPGKCYGLCFGKHLLHIQWEYDLNVNLAFAAIVRNTWNIVCNYHII